MIDGLPHVERAMVDVEKLAGGHGVFGDAAVSSEHPMVLQR
jgi:hypothetical protein